MASRSSIPGEGITEKMVDDADGSLVNWKFHLPDDKKNILRPDGEIDGMPLIYLRELQLLWC